MENEKFNAYGDYKCQLESGKEIKVERIIYCDTNNIQEELEVALNSDFETELVKLQEEELKVFEDLKKKLDDWQMVAEKVKVMQLAKMYDRDCKKVEELETTNNEWVNTKDWANDDFRISNKTYKMLIRVYEDTKYEKGVDVPYRWQVSYWLHTNNGNSDYNSCRVVAAVDRKTFTDKDSAYKYVEGRKKFFSKYFKELYQPIVEEEDIKYFLSCGKLIKGYRIEK